MGNSLTKLFLRLYAANLRRTWRNGPGDAWSDAVFAIDSIITVSALSMIMVVWVVATVWLPNSIGKFGMPAVAGLPLVVVVGFVVDYFVSKRFIHYKMSPIDSDSFSKKGDTAVIYIAMVLSFLFAVVMIVTVAMLRRGQR
jgi:hypothetical protein